MLSFLKSSRSKSETVYLYQVVYGSSTANRMFLTDAEENVILGGDKYAPSTIEHDEISASGNLDKAQIELRCNYDSPLSRVFINYPPDRTVTLRILEGEKNDPDKVFSTIWSGRILGFSVENLEAKFSCEPIGTSVRRPGLRRNYQFGCPHALYGPQCKALKIYRTVKPYVRAMSGSVIRLRAGWHFSFDPLKFQRGIAEWTAPDGSVVTRTVLQVLQDPTGATDLILSGQLNGLSELQQISLSIGCNHQVDDCKDIHNNINNFGGQPWIPLKNPIGSYNSFY